MRSEAFASKNNVLRSFLDALGMGTGFTLALFILGSLREILGKGSILGIKLFGVSFKPLLVMVLPAGAFLSLGLMVAVMKILTERRK